MEKMKFNISINAPRQKVWDTLWNDETYRAWTAEFSPGSHAVTDWKDGSKVLFLGADDKGGMVAYINEKREPEYMSFKHVGIVKDGVEDTSSDEVKNWAGILENYTLVHTNDNITELQIDVDTNEEFKSYFEETWPKALAKLKEISEA